MAEPTATAPPGQRTPPPYKRRRLLAAPTRPTSWRWGAERALDAAIAAGQVGLFAAVAVRAVLGLSSGAGPDVTGWTQAELGGRVQRSGRTWRRWLRVAEAAGWVEVEHRARQTDSGRWLGLPLIYRVTIPADVLALLPPAVLDVLKGRRSAPSRSGRYTPPARPADDAQRPAPQPWAPPETEPDALGRDQLSGLVGSLRAGLRGP